jgi:hypothetical protein
MEKWLVALGVFCMCMLVVTIIVCIIWLVNEEDDEESVSKSTSTSSSSSSTKICYDTKLRIAQDKDCEDEYEKVVCPNLQCRPEETKRMCTCLISPSDLSALPFVGKTYVLGIRKITIKSNGEVLSQDNSFNDCYKSYVYKTTVNGNTRYVFGNGYYENGVVFIYDGVVDFKYKVATELQGFTPRTDCVNILRWG